MDAGSAYIVKRILREKWAGDIPCAHSRVEQVTDLALDHREWFCLICGRDVTEPAPKKKPAAPSLQESRPPVGPLKED
jgi:hypothetical protein